MAKKNKDKLNATEFYEETMRRHLELLILQFSQRLKGDKIKDLSDEQKYETVISLLADGAVVVVALGNHIWTIRPLMNPKEWVKAPKFLEMSGTYKEISETLDKMKEMGYEQD